MGSRTRRGLILVAYSEFLVLGGLGVFALLPERTLFLGLGIVTSLVPGLWGGLELWKGRREFGPAHRSDVTWTGLAFVALGMTLLVALLAASSISQRPFRTMELRVPLGALVLSVIADTGAQAHVVRGLLIGRQKWWTAANYGLGVIAAVGLAGYGSWVLLDLERRTGGLTVDAVEGPSYIHDFQLQVVRAWAIALLALRVVFWPALYAGLSNVSDAEVDSEKVDSARGGDDLR